MGATRGPDGSPARLTWAGLIRNGLDYLVNDVYNGTQDDRIRRAYSALESRSAEGLSDAAMIMKARLEQNKRYPTWLTSVFRDVSDEIQDHRVLDALKMLHKEGAMLLTTNYDDILEKHCDLQRVRRSMSREALHYAIRYSEEEVVSMLLLGRPDVEARWNGFSFGLVRHGG